MEREDALVVHVTMLWSVVIWWCITSSSSSSSSRAETNMQVVREVLTAFKQGVRDPTGALASWDVSNASSDPCSSTWQGLECDMAGRQAQLVTIDLHNRSLGGTVSPQLARLAGLLSLDLSQNALSGTLPFLPNLSSASSLQTLHLHSNAFTGPLTLPPSCFPRLSSLRVDLNSFSGPLPPQLPSCPSLLSLNLSNNQFTGTLFPSGLGNLTTLLQLDAGRNQLHGPIPPSIGNCSSLTFLSLPVNNISGSIPPSIGLGCRNLTFFSFFQNNGSGRIPPEIGLLSKLTYLSLGLNRFSGDFGLQLLANCSELITLDLSQNPVTGRMPALLGSWMPKLQVLALEFTMYTGSIPVSLGNCSDLIVLVAGFNYNLSGTIPAALFQCQHLIHLDLQQNAFTGSIPPQIRNLSNVQTIYFNRNQLTGRPPKELGMLASIQALALQDNSLSGYIPNQVFNCSTLQALSFQNNHISGTLSSSIGGLIGLELFTADNNMLTGVLPSELSNCTKLGVLSLSSNLFSGEIPDNVISHLSQTTYFGLSRNNLSGPIPQGFAQMIHLLQLDLSENILGGSIPSTLGDCVSLQSLNLSHNNLEGGIPSTLENLRSLLVLNLSHNSLSGHIPAELGNLTAALMQLDLSFNALSGTVPSALAAMRALLLLNLSYNNLEGAIPDGGVFGNFTSASFLGNPRLCGHIVNRPCSTARHGALTKRGKIGLAVAGAILIAASILAGIIFFRIRRRSTSGRIRMGKWDYSPFLRLKLRDIEEATNSFSEENVIGSGVTGTVYKGILADGKVVAFKRFKLDNTAIRSFFGELQSMGAIRHRNLVKILGYWSNQLDTNILILEYMSNGSLDDHLHANTAGDGGLLSWELRLRIALSVAQGLVYLHYDGPAPVIHCDIKPKNILLDSDMEVRITDFGLAKVMAATRTSTFSDNMQGSLGYMAPELVSYGHISRRCDVYSYGIVVMELISGRKPTEQVPLDQEDQDMISLVQWVGLKFQAGKILDIVDARLKGECDDHENEIKQLLSLALQCTQEDPHRRPTMQYVVQTLLSLSSTNVASTPLGPGP